MRKRIEEEIEEERWQQELEAKKRADYEQWLKTFNIDESKMVDKTSESYKTERDSSLVAFVKSRWVVSMAELMTRYELSVDQIIDKLTSHGVQGVYDQTQSRYVVLEEDQLKALAQFIEKKGRASRQEVAD